MDVFLHPEFDAHETVSFCSDAEAGLRAIIAVHNTNLGASLGGCRMWPYASEAEALTDVLRLSRGMTYKAALAGLPQGGGKSVIIGDPRRDKTPALFHAMGEAVQGAGGAYWIAEDSGTSVDDLRLVAERTRYVGGLADAAVQAAGHDGDPSPSTARGVYIGIRAAALHALQRDDLRGLRVAVQGLGHVGYRLAQMLAADGVQLWVADLYAPAVARCVSEFGAIAIDTEQIHALDVDVFAPCALGAGLNARTIPQLRARIVAGAANNQLARAEIDGAALAARGIVYAPDYCINAGGIIDIHYQGRGYQSAAVEAHLQRIGATLTTIFERAAAEQMPTHQIADRMAEEIFRR
jgi:leucine dehydrogenase